MSPQVELNASGGEQERRPYEAPQLARVDLKADEVLAIGCKTDGLGGGVNAPICVLNGCATSTGS